MKINFLITCLLFLLLSGVVSAQITFETKYLGNSKYRDINNENLNNSEGSAMVYLADIKIPLSMKKNEDSLSRIWGLQASGAHAVLDNKNFASQDLVVSNITNVQLTAFHLRSLNEKWSMLAFLGAGIYTAEKPSLNVNGNTILANGGAIFIKKINPNLDLGAGLALTNAFGYPIVLPAIYLNYNYDGKYNFKVNMTNGLEASAGYEVNKYLGLSLVTELNGQVALLENEGKKTMFTHQYFTVGLRPEIKISKNITLPFTIGFNANRSAYSMDRKLKSIFNSTEYTPHFKMSPYASAKIEISF